jgi:hypothetical protein
LPVTGTIIDAVHRLLALHIYPPAAGMVWHAEFEVGITSSFVVPQFEELSCLFVGLLSEDKFCTASMRRISR